MPGKKYFIDSHCHFFNVADVPLFNIIDRINLNLLRLAIVWPKSLNDLKDMVAGFFLFMENDIASNIQRVINEMNSACGTHVPGYGDKLKIVTPLIMDFEKSKGCGHEKLKHQVANLLQGINTADKHALDNDFRVLPFLGLSMKRFDKSASFDDTIKGLKVSFPSVDERREPTALNNGDFIGIKLYPSLGFDPFPEGDDEKTKKKRDNYLNVYKHISDLGLPVTIHCQRAAHMSGDRKKKELLRYTDPANWLSILKDNPGLHDLRINFAHFGGEESVRKTVLWDEEDDDLWGADKTYSFINKRSWTYRIIELLKKYPNTYSDISAFDFTDARAVASLAWILSLDQDNMSPFKEVGKHKLIDKLLWGSDYPMILMSRTLNGGYVPLMDSFINAIDTGVSNLSGFIMPPRDQRPESRDFIDKLTNINPARFLFDR